MSVMISGRGDRVPPKLWIGDDVFEWALARHKYYFLIILLFGFTMSKPAGCTFAETDEHQH